MLQLAEKDRTYNLNFQPSLIVKECFDSEEIDGRTVLTCLYCKIDKTGKDTVYKCSVSARLI